MATTITREALGAWLIKCGPESRSHLLQARGAGAERVTGWCLLDGARSRIMEPGDTIILWVSGDGKIMTRGIWGIGTVEGRLKRTKQEPLPPGYTTAGVSEEDRPTVTLSIDVDIPLFEDVVAVDEIRAAGVGDLEVLRIAAGRNPSWITKHQLSLLEPLLDRGPRERQ